jgi:hypothetical protein
MSDRPEYVRCVIRPMAANAMSRRVVWCSRDPLSSEFLFEGLDYALASKQSGSRLVACPDCVEAAIHGLVILLETLLETTPSEGEPLICPPPAPPPEVVATPVAPPVVLLSTAQKTFLNAADAAALLYVDQPYVVATAAPQRDMAYRLAQMGLVEHLGFGFSSEKTGDHWPQFRITEEGRKVLKNQPPPQAPPPRRHTIQGGKKTES